MSPELNQRLGEGKELFFEIGQGAIASRGDAVESLMSVVRRLGAALGRDPGLITSAAAASFLEQLRSMGDRVLLGAYLYLVRTSHLLNSSWQAEEWFEVCRRRSAVEFLRGFLSVPLDEEFLCTETVDRLIRERGDTEGVLPPGGVEPGIPPSHWWWWYPHPPPER